MLIGYLGGALEVLRSGADLPLQSDVDLSDFPANSRVDCEHFVVDQ